MGSSWLRGVYDDLGVMNAFTSTALDFTDRAIDVGGAGQVFSNATSGTLWAMTGAGVPLVADGSNAFGNDRINDYSTNQLLPLAGGDWSHSGYAGVWALSLSASRTNSSHRSGFRAALYL